MTDDSRSIGQRASYNNVSLEDLGAFWRGTADAVFLLGDDLASYLDDMGARAIKLRSAERRLAMRPGDEGAISKADENMQWLTDQQGELVKRFKPFLLLDPKDRS